LFTEEEKDEGQISKEIEYTLNMIELVPQNESPYNYIRGVKNYYKVDYSKLGIKDRLIELIDNDNNYHALSLLADIYEEEGDQGKFNETIERLAIVDSIRKKYWLWRRENYLKT
jgi:protein farnesyltransferase/geranylgeranyltransferase type-1 subunit alpha